ncbi:hypothetical protein ABBQ32_009611 [Trebouxia sp. C0010 RCD-2024]
MTPSQPTWVAAATLQRALAADITSACTCDDALQKRLAHASAVAKQHIALGLAPHHTQALRALPACTAPSQDLLQQMLYFNKHRTPATQGVTSPSVSVTSHAQSEPLLPHTVQRKSGVAAATVCPPSSKQSKAASAEKHSRLPQQGSIAEMHQQRSLRSEQAAPSKEAVAAEKQAVSVVAKPELYSALTAAVSAIVQQAGCAQSQPAADCLRGISLQYHAQGEGAQLEGQASQPEGQASQPEGQDAELDGQSAQLEGQASQPEAQASQLHGQREGHDTQQTCIELQDEDPCSPSKTAVSGASPKIQMSRQAQHAQRSTADATQPASGQQVAHGDEQGGVADGPEQALAWQVQVQIQQAVEVLQAALQPSGKVGAPTGVVASRQQPAGATQHAQRSTCASNMDGQHAKHASLDASWPQAWPNSHEQDTNQSPDQDCSRHAPVFAAHPLPGQATHRLAKYPAAYKAGHMLPQQGELSVRGPPQGVRRGGYGLSTDRPNTPSQQSCRPCSSQGEDCMDARWQNSKRQASGSQRRLYKHGPVVPKPSAMQQPVRRRQRPEWDDHLTATAPQADRGGSPREGRAGLSPRPTAKELLQEALARIQNASNSRPQHAKRQRRSTAPQQGQPCPAVPHHQRATDKLPPGQSRPGVAQQGSGHSWGDDATAARGQGDGQVQGEQQQAAVGVQHHKQVPLVKQWAFGSKPSWVVQGSGSPGGTAEQHGAGIWPSERSRERKVPTAAAPHFATTDKAEAWQKLTDLQQHMVGLITAVEDQLSLADSPNSPRGLRAGNSAERTAEAALSAVGTAQQQEWAAPPRGTPQAHEQPEIHLSGLKTDCDDPGGKAACSEAEDAAPAVEDAVAAATAAGHAAAACSTQKVQRLQPKAGALSDSDVHRILAHRRAYLKQQRAFDRACVDSNEAFDPTQVVEGIADMLLDDVLQQSAAELGEACDGLAEELFEGEFVV